MIKLNTIIVDNDFNTCNFLNKLLKSNLDVERVVSTTPNDLHNTINANTNTIIIDPFADSLEYTSDLIFNIRKNNKNIVFTLFTDFKYIEDTPFFFEGERKRFRHYYKLNKRTPVFLFETELNSIISKCQNYLLYKTPNLRNSKNDNFDLAISIKNLVNENKLKEALERLKEYFGKNDKESESDVILLNNKLSTVEKDKHIVINYQEYMITKMQVANATLEIINNKLLS